MNIVKVQEQIGNVNRDTNINTRTLNPDIILQYRNDMTQVYSVDDWQEYWGSLPKMTQDKTVYSGFHTLQAAEEEFGLEHVVSFVVEGQDRRDAYFLATGRKCYARVATHKRGKTEFGITLASGR